MHLIQARVKTETTFTFGTNPNGGPPVERIRITDIGNCGIGTSSPDQLLHLKSSSSFLAISNSADTGDSGLLFRRGDNNQNRGYVIYDFTNDALKFRASTNGAGEAMRITSAGLVGINETSPAGSLHVNADSGVDGPVFDSGGSGNTNHALLVRDSANSQLLRVNNNGNVGIATHHLVQNYKLRAHLTN